MGGILAHRNKTQDRHLVRRILNNSDRILGKDPRSHSHHSPHSSHKVKVNSLEVPVDRMGLVYLDLEVAPLALVVWIRRELMRLRPSVAPVLSGLPQLRCSPWRCPCLVPVRLFCLHTPL